MLGATTKSALGDAYTELGEFDKAVRAYMDAADNFENDFTTPIILKKAGIVYEELGEYEKALEVYERVSLQYPDTAEGREMNKYMGRVESKLSSL